MFDLATSFFSSIDKDSQKSMKYFLLLLNLEGNVNGAMIEMRRLERTRKAILNKMNQRKIDIKNYLTYLTNDTHFYFICIDKVFILLSRLGSELNNPDIKKLAKKLGKIFGIRTVRNHLEHIDARCLGFLTQKDERNKISKPIQDFGNFVNDNFSFNNKKFPSGKAELKELKKIYKELLVILRKKYANHNPHFLWQEQSEKSSKQL